MIMTNDTMVTSNAKRFASELLGTLALVFFGCGAAVFSSGSGLGTLAIPIAFGLVLYLLHHFLSPISGCHLNPAVTVAMAMKKRISWIECYWYIAAQLAGAIIGALLLFGLVKSTGIDKVVSLGQNGYSVDDKDMRVGWLGALLLETVLTFVFVLVVLNAGSKKNGNGKFTSLIIGAALALVHIIGVNLTGTSVNPARSLAPAIFVSGALEQVWVFFLAPFLGGILAAVADIYLLHTEDSAEQRRIRNEIYLARHRLRIERFNAKVKAEEELNKEQQEKTIDINDKEND